MVTLWRLLKDIFRVASTQYHGTRRTQQCLLQQAMTALCACKAPFYQPLPTTPNKYQLDRRKQPTSPNGRPKSTARRLIQRIPSYKRIENHISILISIGDRKPRKRKNVSISMLLFNRRFPLHFHRWPSFHLTDNVRTTVKAIILGAS